MKIRVENLVIFLLLADVLLPSLIVLDYGLTASVIFSPFIILLYLHLVRSGEVVIWWQQLSILSMCFMVWFSTLWSYAFLGVGFELSDFIESVKYLKFLPYLFMVQFMRYKVFERHLEKWMVVGAIFLILIGLIQLIFSDSIGWYLANIYAGNQADGLLSDSKRIVLTGSDPNNGAAICACFGFYFFTVYLRVKSKLSAFFVVALTVLLLLTQSRTGLAAFVFSIAFYLLFVYNGALIAKAIAAFSFVMAAWLSYEFMNQIGFEYMVLGFQLFFEGNDASTNVRIENLMDAIGWFNESMLFGYGPAKSIHPTVIDSEYALIIGRYALLGVLVFGAYISIFFMKSYAAIKEFNELQLLSVTSGILYLMFGLVLMLTNTLFSGYQLMAPLILFSIGARLLDVKYYRKVD